MFTCPEMKKDALQHICITEPLRLGHAEILCQSEAGILAYDHPGRLLLLSARDVASANLLLDGFAKEHKIDFIMLCGAQLAPAIARFNLRHSMRCLQAAYLRSDPPASDPRLTISAPDARGFARILSTYHMDSPAELRRRRDAGELFFARDQFGADVGFVGLHPEGCFGMVEVFPDQRGKGYGKALEAHIIRFCMETGRVPYCQVEVDNAISLHLQRSLGLTLSEKPLLMAWNEWE